MWGRWIPVAEVWRSGTEKRHSWDVGGVPLFYGSYCECKYFILFLANQLLLRTLLVFSWVRANEGALIELIFSFRFFDWHDTWSSSFCGCCGP